MSNKLIEFTEKLWESNRIGEKVAIEIKEKLNVEVSIKIIIEEIIFDLYVFDDKCNYIKVYVNYEENKEVKDYVKEILTNLQEEQYTYYKASKIERDIKQHLEKWKAMGIEIYEGDIWIDGKNINILDIDDWKINEDLKMIHLTWEDKNCLITIDDYGVVVEWFDKDEYEKMKQEEEKYNEVIEGIKEVINDLKAEDKKKKDIEFAKCVERLIKKEMLEKSNELDEHFERFKLMNNIKF